MFGRKAKRIETLQRQLATALGIIGERDDVIQDLVEANGNLDERNARLRAQNKDLRESNLRLLNDANLLRQRLPQLTVHEGDYPHVQNVAYIPDYEDREQPWTEER